MSEIRIRRAHALPAERARELAEPVAPQLGQEFALDYRWHGNTLKFERDGVRGELLVDEGAIRITAHLGFPLSFLEPSIEREILVRIERMFVAPGEPAVARSEQQSRGQA